MPGVFATIKRAGWVKIHALNHEGRPFALRAEGLLAMCVQHEVDHLQGMLFVEYLPSLRRTHISSRLGVGSNASS